MDASINAGDLRTPVFLGRPVITKDNAGGEAITWEEFKTWAAIEPVGGREWASGLAIKDAVDCRITVRITAGWVPSARWRVRDPGNGRIYNLLSALLMEEHGAAKCLAQTEPGNADGR